MVTLRDDDNAAGRPSSKVMMMKTTMMVAFVVFLVAGVPKEHGAVVDALAPQPQQPLNDMNYMNSNLNNYNYAVNNKSPFNIRGSSITKFQPTWHATNNINGNSVFNRQQQQQYFGNNGLQYSSSNNMMRNNNNYNRFNNFGNNNRNSRYRTNKNGSRYSTNSFNTNSFNRKRSPVGSLSPQNFYDDFEFKPQVSALSPKRYFNNNNNNYNYNNNNYNDYIDVNSRKKNFSKNNRFSTSTKNTQRYNDSFSNRYSNNFSSSTNFNNYNNNYNGYNSNSNNYNNYNGYNNNGYNNGNNNNFNNGINNYSNNFKNEFNSNSNNNYVSPSQTFPRNNNQQYDTATYSNNYNPNNFFDSNSNIGSTQIVPFNQRQQQLQPSYMQQNYNNQNQYNRPSYKNYYAPSSPPQINNLIKASKDFIGMIDREIFDKYRPSSIMDMMTTRKGFNDQMRRHLPPDYDLDSILQQAFKSLKNDRYAMENLIGSQQTQPQLKPSYKQTSLNYFPKYITKRFNPSIDIGLADRDGTAIFAFKMTSDMNVVNDNYSGDPKLLKDISFYMGVRLNYEPWCLWLLVENGYLQRVVLMDGSSNSRNYYEVPVVSIYHKINN